MRGEMSAPRELFSGFDPRAARGGRRGPDVGQDVTADVSAAGETRRGELAAGGPATMSVSALLAQIKGALAGAFPQQVCVVGEISNLNIYSSGHVYFRLKDAAAAIDAVMFRSAASRLKFTPAEGMEVVVEGRVDVYEVRGQLQLNVGRMTPRGQGALELAFRQLREKLQREGLFDPSAKKPPVRFPRAIGVVSSETGAAIHDIRRTLARRWPAADVYLMPAIVQGDQAGESIAQAIRLLDANSARYRIDTLIVARGGGSLEDLWAFNEEVVARAVFAVGTPVISGVGHEVDVTICDLVADVRAATPTAAAELAVPDRVEIARHVSALRSRLNQHAAEKARSARLALEGILRSVVFRDPLWRLRTQVQRMDELSHRLRAGLGEELGRIRRRLEPAANALASLHPARLAERAAAKLDRLKSALAWALGGRSKRSGDQLAGMEARLLASHPGHRLRLARQKIDAARRQLEAMSYRSVLQRGFSVTRRGDGNILRSAADVRDGDRVETELADGKFASVVGQASPPASGPDRPARTAHKPRQKSPSQGNTLFD